MGFSRAQRWRRRAGRFILPAYAVVLLLAPALHHDFACHDKSPLHCTSCVSSQLSSDPQAAPLPGRWSLTDAGCATGLRVAPSGVVLPARTTGRSPPAASAR